MADGDSIAHVAVVILLLSLAVPALATAHEYAGTPLEYEESVTVDYGNTTSVAQDSTGEGYSTTVTITSEGKTLVQGDDYTWDDTAGEITWNNSANTNDGADAQIVYSAYQRTEETAMAWTIIAPLMGLFGVFGLVACVRALWSFVAEVWDL